MRDSQVADFLVHLFHQRFLAYVTAGAKNNGIAMLANQKAVGHGQEGMRIDNNEVEFLPEFVQNLAEAVVAQGDLRLGVPRSGG